MKCFRCPKAAPEFDLFRVNAKGVPAVWACGEHRLERDAELDRIVSGVKSVVIAEKVSDSLMYRLTRPIVNLQTGQALSGDADTNQGNTR